MTPARREAREYLRWAVRHRLASNVEIAWRRRALPVRPVDADRYPALIRRLLVDTDVDIRDRVAGLFVLLYGQSATDIVRLKRLRSRGRPSRAAAALSPSHAGRHLTPDRLQVRLNRLGIFVRDARIVALLNLAVDVPVGVLVDMLGINSSTATRRTHSAGGGWADYTAGRLAAPGDGLL